MIQDIFPHIFHIEYKGLRCSGNDALLCYDGGFILAGKNERGEVILPSVAEAKLDNEIEPRYYFSIDDRRFFGLAGANTEPFGEYAAVPVREMRHTQPRHLAFAAGVGYQINEWYRKHRFCGCCGAETGHLAAERALRCTGCGEVFFPAIPPSVIVALTDGERLLLTRYQSTHSAYRHRALIAGYIEAGETAEDTVRREVMEEVGLRVKNIRYYKSQPWVFSGSLLLGYFCELDGSGEITCDTSELSEAVWTERGKLPDRSGDTSLTSEMIEAFRLGGTV